MLASGAKFFGRPDQYAPMQQAVGHLGFDLKPWHVIVALDMEEEVKNAIKELPSRAQVRIRDEKEKVFKFTSAAVYDPEGESVIAETKKTFLHLKIPSSLFSGSSSGPTVQSCPPGL